jgi:hypothetical protein
MNCIRISLSSSSSSFYMFVRFPLLLLLDLCCGIENESFVFFYAQLLPICLYHSPVFISFLIVKKTNSKERYIQYIKKKSIGKKNQV